MTEKELKKLSRGDLVEMFLAQSRENEQLQIEFEKVKEQLAQRKLTIDNAGSIAEASLQLTGIFEAAQASCSIYMENIEQLSARQEEICANLERQCRERCEQLERETTEKCERLEYETTERCEQLDRETVERCTRLEAETEEKCSRMIADAKKESQEYWTEVSGRVKEFYESYTGLKELLNLPLPEQE